MQGAKQVGGNKQFETRHTKARSTTLNPVPTRIPTHLCISLTIGRAGTVVPSHFGRDQRRFAATLKISDG